MVIDPEASGSSDGTAPIWWAAGNAVHSVAIRAVEVGFTPVSRST